MNRAQRRAPARHGRHNSAPPDTADTLEVIDRMTAAGEAMVELAPGLADWAERAAGTGLLPPTTEELDP